MKLTWKITNNIIWSNAPSQVWYVKVETYYMYWGPVYHIQYARQKQVSWYHKWEALNANKHPIKVSGSPTFSNRRTWNIIHFDLGFENKHIMYCSSPFQHNPNHRKKKNHILWLDDNNSPKKYLVALVIGAPPKCTLIISDTNMVHAYLFWSIRLLVSNSLYPAIFSTAILLKNPTRPVPKPIRSAKVHLRIRYWNIWTFFLDLQSCLKRSFSTILKIAEERK